jgi:alkylated DNA nucleotide flippase Atl1
MVAGFGGIAVDDSCGMDFVVKKAKKGRSKKVAAAERAGKLRLRIEARIREVPRGKVSTYGAIARAAGLPRGARQVARVLVRSYGLPWQRILGSGGEIKCPGEYAMEQRFRLEAEGVRFRGRRVDMKAHEWKFKKENR